MTAGIGTFQAVLWWLGLAAFFLLVVPVVVAVANRVVRAAREIKAYAEDVLEHGVGLAGNLGPVPQLARTRELAREVATGLARYEAAVDRILGRGTS